MILTGLSAAPHTPARGSPGEDDASPSAKATAEKSSSKDVPRSDGGPPEHKAKRALGQQLSSSPPCSPSSPAGTSSPANGDAVEESAASAGESSSTRDKSTAQADGDGSEMSTVRPIPDLEEHKASTEARDAPPLSAEAHASPSVAKDPADTCSGACAATKVPCVKGAPRVPKLPPPSKMGSMGRATNYTIRG